ncbi:MAG: glutamine amidotransferase [Pseudomonadota bacterium]
MKPFLILQARPETEAADEEYGSFLAATGLAEADTRRIRLDEAPFAPVDLSAVSGVIVGGGPGCVSDDPASKDPVEARIEADLLALMPEIMAREVPFMGCCYGLGILAAHLGGEVSKARFGEPIGGVDCTMTPEGRADPLLAGLPQEFRALVGHKEAVQATPPGAVHLVQSESCPMQMIRAGQHAYATQFHPEADGESFATRIRIYKDRGYFPPGEAASLTEAALAEDIAVPPLILRAFAERYAQT